MMGGPFTEGEIYAKNFLPKHYLDTYYNVNPDDDDEGVGRLVTFFLRGAHRAFTVDGIKGDTLIDIGTGPNIHQFLSACESFREIIATDYTDQNREEVQRWLKKELGAFDWTSIVKYICELEGDRDKWPEKEEKVRRAVKRYLKCDVTQPNPLAPLVLPPADCLVSSLCLDAACKDIPTYRSAFRNISSLLKPAGHFLYYTTLEGDFYMVGQRKFSLLYLGKEMVEEAVRQAGFAIKWIEETRINFPPSLTDVKKLYYLETYYKVNLDEDDQIVTFFLRGAHKAFATDGIKGDTLIDIGTGPTIHQFLSACESFREIIATDYTDQNREEVQRWLKKEPGAFDWTPFVKYVCELEGDRDKWPEKEEKVRRAVKRYLKCDVTQPNPLAPLVLPPADCLLSSLCFDGACKDIPTYRSAFRNISSLLKPGGHLLFYTTLEEHYYMIGQRKFSALYLEKEMVEEAVRQAGFAIRWIEETKMKIPLSIADGKKLCILLAQKCSP